MEEPTKFIDAEEYTGSSSEMSFKELILRHLGKISEICTCEFREGYWQEKPVKVGDGISIARTYIDDKRDAYVNAVDFLHDMLLPHFDDEMTKASKKNRDTLNKRYKKFAGKKSDWKDKKQKIKRLLFQQLSLLLERLKYLETKKYTQ